VRGGLSATHSGSGRHGRGRKFRKDLYFRIRGRRGRDSQRCASGALDELVLPGAQFAGERPLVPRRRPRFSDGLAGAMCGKSSLRNGRRAGGRRSGRCRPAVARAQEEVVHRGARDQALDRFEHDYSRAAASRAHEGLVSAAAAPAKAARAATSTRLLRESMGSSGQAAAGLSAIAAGHSDSAEQKGTCQLASSHAVRFLGQGPSRSRSSQVGPMRVAGPANSARGKPGTVRLQSNRTMQAIGSPFNGQSMRSPRKGPLRHTASPLTCATLMD